MVKNRIAGGIQRDVFLRRFRNGTRLNVLQFRAASDQAQGSSLVFVDMKMVVQDAEAHAFAFDWMGAGRTSRVRGRNNDSNLY